MNLFYQGWFAKIIDIKLDKINDNEIILGKGGFGTVFKGKMKIENIKNTMETREVPIAIKRITIPFKQQDKERAIEYIKRELSVYEQIKSKNIVQLYGSEQKNNYYYLYLELCDGNLLNYITDENGDAPIKEEEALKYFIKIFDTLKLLKKSECQRSGQKIMKSLYHRDINVKNILIKKGRAGIRVKLCDFGMSQYEFDQDDEKRDITQNSGTPGSMCPENESGKKYELEKNDTWSLGILLFCLLFGYQLFQKNVKLFSNSSNDDHFNLINQLTTSILVKQLLFGLLQKDPKKRMNYQQIKDSFCYQLYRNNSVQGLFIHESIQWKSQFQDLTSIFFNMEQNLFNQIPQDLLLMVFQNYKNWVYKQCDNYSGHYKMMDDGDICLPIQQNSINYRIIPNILSKQYLFFQNIQLENEQQNNDKIITFWRKVISQNNRIIYQKTKKYYFLNILYGILDKLQLEQSRIQTQILELNQKKKQNNDNKKQVKYNQKLQMIEQLENQKSIQLKQLNDLITSLTQYFELKKQQSYDSQFKY